VVKALRAAGFEVVGIRGSHHYLYHAHRDVIVTVPVHSGRIFAPKTLQAILFQPGSPSMSSGHSCSNSSARSFLSGLALTLLSSITTAGIDASLKCGGDRSDPFIQG